jgi:hypothetical protein
MLEGGPGEALEHRELLFGPQQLELSSIDELVDPFQYIAVFKGLFDLGMVGKSGSAFLDHPFEERNVHSSFAAVLRSYVGSGKVRVSHQPYVFTVFDDSTEEAHF